MRSKLLLLSVILSSGFYVGCSDDDDPAPPSPLPVVPTPGPVDPLGPDWTAVLNERFSDAVDLNECDMPFVFEVEDSGEFRAGPCTEGGSDVKEGKINAVELVRLDRLATAVANNNLRNRECEDTVAIAGSTTELALSNNRTREIYRHTPDELCYRGEKAEAKALHDYVSALSVKYYPKFGPQPTATPTPVPTGTPAPTPRN
jgi:hypothetical protein